MLEIQVSVEEQRQAKALQLLIPTIPQNEYGLPLGIYRLDYLPFDSYQVETPLQLFKPVEIAPDKPPTANNKDLDDKSLILDASEEDVVAYDITERTAGFPKELLAQAFVPLSYDEGFPTFPDGHPFWNQLTFESPEAFATFETYLQMPGITSGVRTIVDLPFILQQDGKLNGVEPAAYVARIQAMFHLYYWASRTKAYDLFKLAASRHRIETHAVEVLDSQYNRTTNMLVRLATYMDKEEDFWDEMTPKIAVDMYKMLTQVQRVSAGLPSTGPPKENDTPAQSFEMTLRTISQSGHKTEVHDASSDSSTIAERVLSDPEMAGVAQELIIKLMHQRT